MKWRLTFIERICCRAMPCSEHERFQLRSKIKLSKPLKVNSADGWNKNIGSLHRSLQQVPLSEHSVEQTGTERGSGEIAFNMSDWLWSSILNLNFISSSWTFSGRVPFLWSGTVDWLSRRRRFLFPFSALTEIEEGNGDALKPFGLRRNHYFLRRELFTVGWAKTFSISIEHKY